MEFFPDTWLLNKFEQFSHWTQKTIGVDCFQLARISVLLGIVLIILKPTAFLEVKLLKFSLPLVMIIWLFHIQIIEKEVKRCIEKGLMNPRKRDIFQRMFVCMWVFIHLCVYFSSFSEKLPSPALFTVNITIDFSVISVLYFLSCDPLPPVKSKARKLLEKAGASLKKLTALIFPKPIPTPAENPS